MPLTGDPLFPTSPRDGAVFSTPVPLVVRDSSRLPSETDRQTGGAPTETSADAAEGPRAHDVDVEASSFDCQLDRVPVWGVPFDRVTMQQSVNRITALVARKTPSYVITANLNYLMLHHQQRDLFQVTRDAAMILADGQPIVWRSRASAKPLPERVAGSELVYRLAEEAGRRGWGVYFLGGEPGVAQACADRLQAMNPGLRVAGVESPPFRPLTPQEQRDQDARITESGADLLLVAFGQPKGEQWIHANYRRLGIPVSIQLGASFDFIAGTAKRAPRTWQRFGMEWAYRMLSDPKRLVPRYWANLRFLFAILVSEWRPWRRSPSRKEQPGRQVS